MSNVICFSALTVLSKHLVGAFNIVHQSWYIVVSFAALLWRVHSRSCNFAALYCTIVTLVLFIFNIISCYLDISSHNCDEGASKESQCPGASQNRNPFLLKSTISPEKLQPVHSHTSLDPEIASQTALLHFLFCYDKLQSYSEDLLYAG